jgi:hypothetical protein
MPLPEILAGTNSCDRAVLEALGVKSALDGGAIFCGVTLEEFAVNGHTYQWPRGSKLSWNLAFSRLGTLNDLDLKDAFSDGLEEVAKACDLRFEFTQNPRTANILCNVQRLDGGGGVLADMHLPVGNVTTDTQLTGRFDDSEAWVVAENPRPGQIDFYRVALHEFLHALGLGHKPASIPGDALIAPIYSARVRNLQPLDIQELVRRYGPSKNPGPSAEPPPALRLRATVEVDANGVKFAASGDLKRVQ